MKTVSFIIPSINRETLKRTIDSIEIWPGDEIIVEFDIPKSNTWGNPQRNKGIARAKCDYISFMDDDDYYVKGHREIMNQACIDNPGKPNLFKIKYPGGMIIWDKKEVVFGNISSQQIFIPNEKDKLPQWHRWRNSADFVFVDGWGWDKEDIVWREEIISLQGHDR